MRLQEWYRCVSRSDVEGRLNGDCVASWCQLFRRPLTIPSGPHCLNRVIGFAASTAACLLRVRDAWRPCSWNSCLRWLELACRGRFVKPICVLPMLTIVVYQTCRRSIAVSLDRLLSDTMLASRLRPCASQFGRYMQPLRVRNYSSVAEKSYEYIKVSTPRAGVGLS